MKMCQRPAHSALSRLRAGFHRLSAGYLPASCRILRV